MNIKIPVIRVQNGLSKTIHIVGTDIHDELYIQNNCIHYENTNNFTGSEIGSYQYIGEKNDLTGQVNVEFVSIEEFIEMITANYEFDKETLNRLNDFKISSLKQEEDIKKAQEDAVLLAVL